MTNTDNIQEALLGWFEVNENGKFSISVTPKFFANPRSYKLAVGLVENANKHVGSGEQDRFKCECKIWRDFDKLPFMPEPVYYNYMTASLVGTAIIAELKTHVIQNWDTDFRQRVYGVNMDLQVNGTKVQPEDTMRISEASRCLLALPEIQLKLKSIHNNIVEKQDA